MKESLKLEIATITLWHTGAIMITLVAMTVLYMKANRTATLSAFFKVEVAMLIWMVGKVMKTVAFNVDLRWYAIVLYYGGICFLEVAFLEFGYAYYKGVFIKKSIRRWLYLVATIQFIVIATNPLHHLFYQTYDFYRDSFGPLFYVHVLVEYIFILVGGIFCAIRFQKHLKNVEWLYKWLVGMAIVVPVIMNLVYISGSLRSLLRSVGINIIFDVTPIVFTWSLLLFMYVTFRYAFFELTPIMRHEILRELTTPMCILDEGLELVFVNEALGALYNKHFYKVILQLLNEGGAEQGSVDNFYQKSYISKRCYNVFIKRVESNKSNVYVVTFKDITSYRLLEKELVSQKDAFDEMNVQLNTTIASLKETSKRGARHYVAREMHDIIGHSLVVAIKLLEVARLYYSKSPKMSYTAMKDAITCIDTGILEMNSITNQEDDHHQYSGQLLEKELRNMMDHVSKTGINTNIQFKGGLQLIEEKTFDVIRRLCTELVTNTLKHSQAENLFLSVKLSDESINIHFIDDGCGCEALVVGNGLRGIKQRLDLIKGKVKYGTDRSDGFSAFVTIPKV